LHGIKLIVGLGNPGAEYESTRHNAGAWFLDALTEQFQSPLRTETKFHAKVSRIQLNGHDCWLMIPNTFMNLSGQAIQALATFYKIPAEQILVAHDELDFPPGTVRIKQDGGHGGHNGLRDTINHLHTKQFFRLRIGIGHPGHKDQVHDYVLSRPSRHDHQTIMDSIETALALVPELIEGDVQKAIKQLHSE